MIIAPVPKVALAGQKRNFCSSQQQEDETALVAAATTTTKITGHREKKQRVAAMVVTTPEQSAKAQQQKQQLQKKQLQRRMLQEAMKEIQPISLGSLAMVASTLCNQGKWIGWCHVKISCMNACKETKKLCCMIFRQHE
jgi:hypothetical protein